MKDNIMNFTVIGKTADGQMVLDNGFTMSGLSVKAFEDMTCSRLPVLVFDTVLGVYVEVKEK